MAPWLRSTVRITLMLIGIGAIALVVTVWLSFRDMCGNGVLTETFSPDGSLKAVVFDRSCGATDSGATEVSVLPRFTPLPNLKGNAFITYNVSGEAGSGYRGRAEVKVRWLDPRSLEIMHHQDAHISVALHAVSDVTIRYSALR
jgi:hypothetical protein